MREEDEFRRLVQIFCTHHEISDDGGHWDRLPNERVREDREGQTSDQTGSVDMAGGDAKASGAERLRRTADNWAVKVLRRFLKDRPPVGGEEPAQRDHQLPDPDDGG